MRHAVTLGCACLLALAVASTSARADTYEVSPGDDAEAAINALGPGDELVLHGGTYTLTERFSFDIAGTESQPIIIRAADGETPHLHRPAADQNIIDIDNAVWVVMRGIEFSGGSAGIRISGANRLTIEECEIHDTGDVALRANDSGVVYDSMRILRNHIHHTNNTGEGMYLGCNNNGCQVRNALIEGNYIHHTNQPSVDQGDGIELKEGSSGNIVRDNVIHDTNYPCILTYSAAGNGPPNVIERNAMWNCGDHGIQSATDAIIRNNIILGSGSDGIAMQPHQSGVPDNLVVVHNTVFHDSNDAISLRSAAGSVIIANNAVYAQSGRAIYVEGNLNDVVVAGNVGAGGVQGTSGGFTAGNMATDFEDASYAGAPPMSVFPASGSALVGAGEVAHVTVDDFNGTAREGVADVGAYAYAAGGNPGWVLAAGFKDSAPVVDPVDAGVPDVDAGDGGSAAGTDGGTPGDAAGGCCGAAGARVIPGNLVLLFVCCLLLCRRRC